MNDRRSCPHRNRSAKGGEKDVTDPLRRGAYLNISVDRLGSGTCRRETRMHAIEAKKNRRKTVMPYAQQCAAVFFTVLFVAVFFCVHLWCMFAGSAQKTRCRIKCEGGIGNGKDSAGSGRLGNHA